MKFNFKFKPVPSILINNMDMYCCFLFLHIYKYAQHQNEEQINSPVVVSLKTLAGDCGWTYKTLQLSLQALVNANLISIELGKNQRDKSIIVINYDTIAHFSKTNCMPFVQKCEKNTVIKLDNTTPPTQTIEEVVTPPTEIAYVSAKFKEERQEKRKSSRTYTSVPTDIDEDTSPMPQYEMCGAVRKNWANDDDLPF